MTEPPCPSAWSLERVLASELDALDPVARHVASCERCQERLESMRGEGQRYLDSAHAERLGRTLRERERGPRRQSLARRWAPPLLLAALSLGGALIFLSPPRTSDPADGEFGLTPKGTAQLVLWTDGADGPSALLEDSVAPGTRLQCGLSAPAPGFVAGFVHDGAALVRLFPAEARALSHDPGAAAPLGPSFVVDEATREVTVSFYWSPEPFDVDALEAQLGDPTRSAFAGTVLQRKVAVRSR